MSNLKWEEMEFIFVSHDILFIRARDVAKKVHCANVGLVKPNGEKNRKYETLQKLSRRSTRQTFKNDGGKKDQYGPKIRQQVSVLRKHFKRYFSIDDDPFQSDWKPKFLLNYELNKSEARELSFAEKFTQDNFDNEEAGLWLKEHDR